MRASRIAIQRAGAVGLVLVVVAIAACVSSPPRRWPFPAVSVTADSEVLALIDARTAKVRSLYAELSASLTGERQSGVFELVSYYEAPGRLRFSAFRDSMLSVHPLFDLVVRGETFRLRQASREGESSVTAGTLQDLGATEGFGVFAALRESLFLPGRRADAAWRLKVGAKRRSVMAEASDGWRIRWFLDAETLGIERAELSRGDGPPQSVIEYLSYREVDGVFLPEHFRIVEDDQTMEGVLRFVEVDPELESDVFDL